ncbi:hypothetical protein P167DRAFT_464568, partial [Morchella conica CCBAS932]
DVNTKNNKGETPLWTAARDGHESIVAMLLAVDGVNMNAKDKEGKTPLSVALLNSEYAVADLLRAAGASDTCDSEPS